MDVKGVGPLPVILPPDSLQFGGLFDAIPDALVATDVDGVIVRMNEAAGRLFGCSPEALPGLSMEALLSEDFRDSYRVHRRGFLEGGETTGPELECLGLTADGGQIPIDATVGRLEVSGTTYVLMVIREVSDRVATQKDLERRLAIEALVVGVSGRLNTPTHDEIDEAVRDSLGELGRFTEADRSYVFQVSSDGTMSNTHEWCSDGAESWIDALQDVPVRMFPWLMRQVLAGRVVQVPSAEGLPPEARAEQEHMRRAGIRSIVAVPMLSGGKVVGFIGFDSVRSEAVRWRPDEISTFLVLQDFFANALRRQRVAGELQRANRMLQAVSECNDALVRAKQEDGLLRDICRIVVEAGGYALAWVGIALDDAEKSILPVAKWGSDDGYVDALDLTWAPSGRGRGPAGATVRSGNAVVVQNVATDAAFLADMRDEALRRGYASAISVPFEYAERTSGVLSVYATETAAFDTPEVQTLQRFADDLAFGIAALRTRERQRQAEQQLRDMLRSKDEFIATIAHELRTPLTAVVGFAQLLRDGGSQIEPAERAEMVRMVAEQGLDLTNIVDDLLVVAKAEAGTLTVARVQVDLRAQTAQVLESCGLDGSERIEVVEPGAFGSGDPGRVRQIVRNLVTNALRYGGTKIRVTVGTWGSLAYVAVHDDGPGVAPEEQEAIFEPYTRAHDAPGLTASMGLGLTISRQLARLMGGDLTYRRIDDETVFTLLLPSAA